MSDPSNPGDWQQVPPTPGDPAASGYPPPQAGYPPQPVPPQSAPMTPTAAAAISYITFIPAIIFLLIDPYKQIPFVRFHAIQSIALNIVAFAVWIVFLFLAFGLHIIGIGFLVSLIHLCIDLVLFIVWLICIIQASQGKWFKLPILGDFALKQSGQ